MPRFLSTYSAHYLAPEVDEDDPQEVNFPDNSVCKKCTKNCEWVRTPCASPLPSRRNSCTSTSSCVREINQIDFTACPAEKIIRCNCQCCLSKKPERAPACPPPACPLPPICPPPTPPPIIRRTKVCTCRRTCEPKSLEDPCCQLRRVLASHAMNQDPNYGAELVPASCHCKPCETCPPLECNCCRVRNDDPDIKHRQKPPSHDHFSTGCDQDGGTCSRNSKAKMYTKKINTKNDMQNTVTMASFHGHSPCAPGPIRIPNSPMLECRHRYLEQMKTTFSTVQVSFVNTTCPKPQECFSSSEYGESVSKTGKAIADSFQAPPPCCIVGPCYPYCF
ncbi:hypothetical protein quinque_000650 [Culex quinquefasciatus]